MSANLHIEDLVAKWSAISEDAPICAACGVRIETGQDDEDGCPIVPVRLFRHEDGAGLALHPKCFSARLTK